MSTVAQTGMGDMKIFIVGTGGLGGYFGGLLARTGNDVTFLARGEHYKAIKQHGLIIESDLGDFRIHPAKLVGSISEIVNPDLIIFAVKTYDTEGVAQELAHVVDDHTIIISFQNGIDNDHEIKKYIKNAKVFPGLAYVVSRRIAPGLIKQTGGLGKLVFGDRESSNNEQLEAVTEIMRDAGIEASISDDIVRDLWHKFIFICAFSGMTATCRANIGQVLSHPVAAIAFEKCVKEAIVVAKALKVNIASTVFHDVMGITKTVAPDSKSSLLLDTENNSKNEIEALNGTLVRLAHGCHIDVPVNELIYGAIKLSSK